MYKKKKIPQAVTMEKIKVFDGDGKTRDERETCFPSPRFEGKNKGAGTR